VYGGAKSKHENLHGGSHRLRRDFPNCDFSPSFFELDEPKQRKFDDYH
jgi:hypothetical protein